LGAPPVAGRHVGSPLEEVPDDGRPVGGGGDVQRRVPAIEVVLDLGQVVPGRLGPGRTALGLDRDQRRSAVEQRRDLHPVVGHDRLDQLPQSGTAPATVATPLHPGEPKWRAAKLR
jgi:hypothetical protein